MSNNKAESRLNKKLFNSAANEHNFGIGSVTLSEAMAGAKDSQLSLLKIALFVLNDKSDEVDYKLGRPLRLEDFDNLSSELMLKICATLLKDCIGDDIEIHKQTKLTQFNQLGVGQVTYDSGIDQVYLAAKKIFPEDDELFHYSVLLLPTSNPKRTKAVISYIMSFYLMCDSLHDKFLDCFNEVIKENEEKVAICRLIDDARDHIAEIVRSRAFAEQTMPKLQVDIQLVQDEIRKKQITLGKFMSKLEELKTSFEGVETEKRVLLQQLQDLDRERLTWESKIVDKPEEIIAENLNMKNQFTLASKERDTVGSEINLLTKKNDVFESLIDRAKDTLGNFESVACRMEDTKSKIFSYTKSENATTSQAKKVAQAKEELEQLSLEEQERVREINSEKEIKASRSQELELKYTNLKTQLNELKELANKNKTEREHISQNIDALTVDVESSGKILSELIHLYSKEIPQRFKDMEAAAVDARDDAHKSLGTFSPLNIPKKEK